MKKKIIIIIAIVLCIIVAIGVTVYVRPIHVTKQLELFNNSNEKITVELDLTWNRSILNRRMVTGSIKYNGKEYKSCNTPNEPIIDLGDKIRGEEKTYYFSASQNQDYMMVTSSNIKLTKFGVFIDDGNGIRYYETK